MTKTIAEYKRFSPWDGHVTDRPLGEVVSLYDADPDVWGLSIVADERWGGSIGDVREARRLTAKPLLARGFDLDLRETAIAGADFMLTYSAHKALVSASVWLEVHTVDDLAQAAAVGFPPIVIANNRDVMTGQVVPGNAEAIGRSVPLGTQVCAASGYDWAGDALWADYVIVGASFLRRIGG